MLLTIKNIIILLFILFFQALNLNGYWRVVDYNYNYLYRDSDCFDSLHCAALAWASGSSRPKLKITTDGGLNWQQVLPDTILYDDPVSRKGLTVPYSVSYPDEKLIILGCDSGRILIAKDKISNWKKIKLNTKGEIKKIKMVDEYVGVAMSEKKIFKTYDGGYNWTELDIPDTFRVSYYYDISYPDADNIYIYLWSDYYWAMSIITSNDGGNIWEKTNYKEHSTAFMYFYDKDNGWLLLWKPDAKIFGEEYDVIINSKDGGYNWIWQLDQKNEPPKGLRDIDFYNLIYGIAVGNQGKIYKTTDGGNIWSRDFINPDSIILADIKTVSMLSETSALIFMQDGYIYKNDNLAGYSDGNFENSLSTIILSPNPASNLINIKFNNENNFSNSNIKIFDIFGNEIKSISYPAPAKDSNEINVDISELQPGVYFIKSVIGGKVEIAKLLKVY